MDKPFTACVPPVTIALTPYETVSGTMVTGNSRTSRNPARTFRFIWSGFEEDKKVRLASGLVAEPEEPV